MSTDCIPTEVSDFIRDHIESVEQLEILLLLAQNAARDWSAEEVARELRGSLNSAERRLADFAAKRIIIDSKEESIRYRFDSSVLDLQALVNTLAYLYQTRRIAVINQILAKPAERIKVFANAFKIRGDK